MKEYLPSIMMGTFVLALIFSVWKLYKFMPNKQLEDDDNTKESIDQLTFIMIDTIKASSTPPTHKELFVLMKSHTNFDEKHFWRFNENRLHQLLQRYYTIHNLSSIEEIYQKAIQE